MNQLELLTVRSLPTLALLDQEHCLAGQQLDFLCGPYWAAILLRAAGITTVDTVQLAVAAGSVLPTGDVIGGLPLGAKPRQDYRLPLPQTQQIAAAGTTVTGLIEAVASCSAGRFTLVPLRAMWSSEQVEAVLNLCWEHQEWQAVPLCNLRTGLLWGARPTLAEIIAYLEGEAITTPAADWDVGHFLTLAGKVQGSQASLVIVRDTYPMLGWDGYHLQPHEAIATGLQRHDGLEGGILLFVATQDKAEVEQQAQASGFEIATWDNG